MSKHNEFKYKTEEEKLIQIPLEEYKELLITKGRYEELIKKETTLPKITYINGIPVQEFEKEYGTYKITCDSESKGE